MQISYRSQIIFDINYLAFAIVVIFIFFDGIRSNILYRDYLSMLREGALLYLIIITALLCNVKRRLIGYSVFLFVSYHLLISLFSLFLDGRVELGYVVKPIEFVFAIYIFYYFEELTLRKREKLFNLIIYTAIVFSVVNTLLYFIPLPIWNRQSFWWGRISCGYPTMDVVSLSYALVILLYKPNLVIRSWTKFLFSLIIIIEISLNFSGTGMVLLPLCLFPLLITAKMTFKNLIFVFLSILLLVGAFFFIQNKFPDELEDGLVIIENKTAILGGDDYVKNNTLEIRERQFSSQEKRHNEISRIVGLGLNNLTMDRQRLKSERDVYSIENQYNTILMGYGYVGFIFYLLMMVDYLFLIICLQNVTFVHRCMLILFIAIWSANSYTIITLLIFPNFMFLALNLSEFYFLKNRPPIIRIRVGKRNTIGSL